MPKTTAPYPTSLSPWAASGSGRLRLIILVTAAAIALLLMIFTALFCQRHRKRKRALRAQGVIESKRRGVRSPMGYDLEGLVQVAPTISDESRSLDAVGDGIFVLATLVRTETAVSATSNSIHIGEDSFNDDVSFAATEGAGTADSHQEFMLPSTLSVANPGPARREHTEGSLFDDGTKI